MPTAALGQMDDGLGSDSDDAGSSDDGLGSDPSSDELMGSDADESGGEAAGGEDSFADSEPEEDDYSYDTQDDGGSAPLPFEDEEAVVEVGGLFSGRVQFSVFGGYAMRLAGDKTLNLFGEKRRPEVNELSFDPVDPAAVPEAIMASSAFELAEQIQDFYRTREQTIEPKPNPLATSFGARIGLTLPEDPLYVGVAFHYSSGGTSSLAPHRFDSPNPGDMEVVAPAVEHTVSVMMLGGELGLDLDVAGLLVIRPALGLGLAAASSTVCIGPDTMNITDSNSPDPANPIVIPAGCEDASSQRIYFAPSLSAIVPFGMMFASAEGRFIGISGSGGVVGFYLGASAGLSFQLLD